MGTERTCHVTMEEVGPEAVFRLVLGKGLTANIKATNDKYSISYVEGETYSLKQNSKGPVEFDILLSLAKDANVEETSFSISVRSKYNRFLLGDLNGDGEVTKEEVNRILNYETQQENFNEYERKVADVDQNGEITSADALLASQIEDGQVFPVYLFEELVDSEQEYYSKFVSFTTDYIDPTKPSGDDGTTNPSDEVVDVPDTASSIPVWYYVAGAVFMAFGVYLIVEARRKNQVQ